jgi:cyanophycinase
MVSYPKGYLVSIGGAEDKGNNKEEEKENSLDFLKNGILKEVVNLMKANPTIEVITTAGSHPEEAFRNYKKAFTQLGCVNVGHINIRERAETTDSKLLKRLEACDGVFFSGGDQARLSAVLGGTQVLSLIRERYQKEAFVIAGTSAGAAVMSSVMMNGGSTEKAYLKGEVMLSAGFGLLTDVIIDTHFDARGRFARLAQAVATQPGIIGLGLGEDTGVIIEKGGNLKAIGSSAVTIIEGSQIFHNNIAEIENSQPISVGKLGVYILSKSDRFQLATKQLLPAEDKAHGVDGQN